MNVGQGSLLQSSVSFRLPSWHADDSGAKVPSWKIHSRIFVLDPPLQETLHSVHSDQSVHFGQSFSLQGPTSSRSAKQGFGLTPFLSSLQSRTRRWLPPPHDLEHEVQSDHGVNVGQSDSPQLSTVSESPRQSVLLSDDFGRRHSRTFFLDPPPQDFEHAVHSVQSVHSGQGFELQSSVSTRSALHGFPSYDINNDYLLLIIYLLQISSMNFIELN